MEFSSPDEFLVHVLRSFHPYLGTFVLVGGFAVRLYELHARAAAPTVRLLRTFDADLAAPGGPIPIAGHSLATLAEAAGFQFDFRGDGRPPAMKLVPKGMKTSAPDQYTVEFLIPMTGAPASRRGNVVVASDIQAGVTAQRLRYLDLLLDSPWSVPLAGLPGIPEDAQRIMVRVPHPGFFIVQKVLISVEPGRREKRPKDMAYIYQVVSLFRNDLAQLAQDVCAGMAGPARKKWLRRFGDLSASLFKSPTAAGVTETRDTLQAEMAGTGLDAPTADMICRGVSLFLKEFQREGRVSRRRRASV